MFLKSFISLVIAFNVLYARDNPFDPEMTSKNMQGGFSDVYESYFKKLDIDLPTTARILKKISITYQDIDGSIHTKVIPVDKSIDWHYPLKLSQNTLSQSELERRYKIKDFEFVISNNTLTLHSPYKLLRSFVLIEPYRIVLDIKRGSEKIHEVLALEQKFFSQIKLGTHDDFYRISITLDGKYRYILEEKKGAYQLILK
ncbi:AMIN domain-containing protein [Helicobacter cetorum]|uniref:AMIN domain-containing protein n=1 Tax=Helicobacter cetorum TaxID=138563 RepID=UPI000CF08A84|nr:AMIN domain-containing protein [Helicobacter cetorum]